MTFKLIVGGDKPKKPRRLKLKLDKSASLAEFLQDLDKSLESTDSQDSVSDDSSYRLSVYEHRPIVHIIRQRIWDLSVDEHGVTFGDIINKFRKYFAESEGDVVSTALSNDEFWAYSNLIEGLGFSVLTTHDVPRGVYCQLIYPEKFLAKYPQFKPVSLYLTRDRNFWVGG